MCKSYFSVFLSYCEEVWKEEEKTRNFCSLQGSNKLSSKTNEREERQLEIIQEESFRRNSMEKEKLQFFTGF